MSNRHGLLFLGFTLLLEGPLVRADILYIDLNAAEQGPRIAAQEAAQRKEKFHIVPKPGQRPLKKEDLARFAEELTKTNRSISTVIISGHDGGGTFGGKNGQMRRSELAAALPESLRSGVRSLYLDGCYTTTIYEASQNGWAAEFPKLDFIAGFEKKGPLDSRAASGMFLKGVLSLETKMQQKWTEDELRGLVEQLPAASSVNGGLRFMCHVSKDGASYYTRKDGKTGRYETFDFDGLIRQCNDPVVLGALKENSALIRQYFDAQDPNHARPPANTSSSDLRTAYEKLRELQHCVSIYNETESARLRSEAEKCQREGRPFPPELQEALRNGSGLIDPDVAIRLIFFPNVLKNYEALYPGDLKRYREALEWYNKETGKSLKLPDFQTASRAELRDFFHTLAGEIMNNTGYTGVREARTLSRKNAPRVTDFLEMNLVLTRIADQLDPNLVPLDWVEPGSQLRIGHDLDRMKELSRLKMPVMAPEQLEKIVQEHGPIAGAPVYFQAAYTDQPRKVIHSLAAALFSKPDVIKLPEPPYDEGVKTIMKSAVKGVTEEAFYDDPALSAKVEEFVKSNPWARLQTP